MVVTCTQIQLAHPFATHKQVLQISQLFVLERFRFAGTIHKTNVVNQTERYRAFLRNHPKRAHHLGVWVLEDAASRVQLRDLRTRKGTLMFTFNAGGPYVGLRFLLELDRDAILDPIADERRCQASPRRHVVLQPACVHNLRGFKHRFRLTMC